MDVEGTGDRVFGDVVACLRSRGGPDPLGWRGEAAEDFLQATRGRLEEGGLQQDRKG